MPPRWQQRQTRATHPPPAHTPTENSAPPGTVWEVCGAGCVNPDIYEALSTPYRVQPRPSDLGNASILETCSMPCRGLLPGGSLLTLGKRTASAPSNPRVSASKGPEPSPPPPPPHRRYDFSFDISRSCFPNPLPGSCYLSSEPFKCAGSLWVGIPAPGLTGSVTFGKLLNLSLSSSVKRR